MLRDGKEVQIAVPTVVAGDIASWCHALQSLSLAFSGVDSFELKNRPGSIAAERLPF